MLYKLYNHSIEIPSDLAYLGITYEKNISPADIEIKFFGNTNKKKNLLDNQFEIKPNYGFYYREKIGLFEFINGRVMNIYLEGKVDTTLFQTLFNFPLACIFAQNGFLPIHASAVRYREKTLLFPGITKQGKSSLAAILIKLGGKLITEDIGLFRLGKNNASLIPSYPLIKLSDEVNNEISFTSEEPFKLNKCDLKRNLFKLDKKGFYDEESQIDIVIFPEWSEEKEFKSITHKQAVLKVISSNFFTSEIPSLETYCLKNNHAIIKNAECFEFRRKKELKKLKIFQEEIEKLFI